MAAMSVQASADAIERSRSFAERRQRSSQAKVLSTTQCRAMTTKPVRLAGRFTISMAGLEQSIPHKAFAGEPTAAEPVLAEAGA